MNIQPQLRRRQIGNAFRRRRRLRAGLTQLIYSAIAISLGIALPEVDIGFTVSGSQATQILVSVGAGVIAFIGVVYSLLFLVVQFGSTTYTPRLNLFRDSPLVWHSFSYFVSVIVFCFTAALVVGNDEEATGLLSICVVFLLFVAFALFRALQSSAFSSVQLGPTLRNVTSRGLDVIQGVFPEPFQASKATSPNGDSPFPSDSAQDLQWPRQTAILQSLQVPVLLRVAEREHVVIELRARPGETVFEGDTVVIIHGRPEGKLADEVWKALTVGPERTFDQDPLFALRVLADIALRALSSAINDPTTAAQALDGIEQLLRRLAWRDLDISRVTDSNGALRVILPAPDWDLYV
jgi:uncharacterized membrane protein